MTNTYYQKRKARERYKNLPEDEKEKKGGKRPQKDINFLPQVTSFPTAPPNKIFYA